MENRILMMLVFSLVFMLLLTLSSLTIYSMINSFSHKVELKSMIKRTIIFNAIFIGIFLTTFSFQNDLSVGLHRIMTYYMGFVALGLTVALVYWITYFVFGVFGKNQILVTPIVKNITIFTLVFINIYAIYNFEKGLKVKEIKINSNKIKKDYKVLMIGDIQYGSVSKKYMENVFEKALEQKPDFIALVGDLVDFDAYKAEDFDFLKDNSIPIYFINGNHEFYHGIDRISSYLGKIKSVKTLINETTLFNNDIEITGIDYTTSAIQLSKNINEVTTEEDKFSILLYHEPKGIDEGVKKGFDLMLYGHTHGGQIFPFTKLVNLIYKYGNGYYEKGDSVVYTTSGAGLWGPKMRLGTENEIVVFNLKKEAKLTLTK